MDGCNCVAKLTLKEGMAATAPWKSKQPKWKKESTIPGIKHSNLQREKCFFRNNYYLDQRSFLITCYFVMLFLHTC